MIDTLIFGFGLFVVILVGSALTLLITTNNRVLMQDVSRSRSADKPS
jgi:hypothetical protein